jgi:acetyltransferase
MRTGPHSLDSLFHPRAVAILGASATPGSVGSILIRNLLENPFGGVVYPVNPNRKSVQGVYCYPSLAALPEPVDLAVIATPTRTVLGLVQECVAQHVKSAILISAGFSELGEEGRALERQLRETARGHLRLVGPNCLGVLHPPSGLNASFAPAMPRPGHIALLSQSGAICTAILDWAIDTHVGFSSFVSAGTRIDVDFADLIDYFGDDPQTHSIIVYLEAIGDVRKFLSAARAVARTKTIIVVKAGRHAGAARTSASHTGALADADEVSEAAFRRVGILRVDTIPALFNMAEILAMQPLPRGPSLAIITNARGPSVMAVDALVLGGGQLSPLSEATTSALDAVLPRGWSHANPIDLRSDATPQRYRQVIEICAREPAIQGLLALLTPQVKLDPTETARQVAAFAHLEGKPILASWLGGSSVQEGRDILTRAGVPAYFSPEAAIRAFLNMAQYRRNQELLYETPQALPEDWSPDRERVRRVLVAVRGAGRTLLTEAEAKEVLAAYDIPVQPSVPEKGYELIIGSSVDPQFGPVVSFGSGGILAELYQDRALSLPPLTRTLARRLMERTRIYQTLKGGSGRQPVNLEVLETLLVRFSQLVADFLEIAEINIQPLLASPEQVVALGARIVLLPADLPEEQRPRLAIHPYPNQYVAPFRLNDGTEITIRPIRPEDEPLIIAFHAGLSPHTIRMRFFSLVKTLSRDSLIRLCHLDYEREMALVGIRRDEQGPHLVGVSRYYLDPETGEAEFAVVVGDPWQGRGLGYHLMERLIAVARERGVKRLAGSVLRENAPMLQMVREFGFVERPSAEPGVAEVVLDLTAK